MTSLSAAVSGSCKIADMDDTIIQPAFLLRKIQERTCEKYIKIELLGNFIDCTLYFKPSDYNKIMAILKEKSPAKIILNFKDNPNIN